MHQNFSLRSSTGVVILAAGTSSRMGKPKLLLSWGNTSMIGHLLAQWQKVAVEQIAVVISATDPAMEHELDRLEFSSSNRISNPAPEVGMFSSVQCAARWAGWKPNLTHWVIALGDQPHLRTETLLALISVGAVHPQTVCQW